MAEIPPRDLTGPERATLDYLLEADLPDGEALRAQASHAQAVGTCDCGCATIDLLVDLLAAPWTPDPPPSRIAASAMSLPNHPPHPAQLLLHVVGGRLLELEIVDYSGENPQATFPALTTWANPTYGEPRDVV